MFFLLEGDAPQIHIYFRNACSGDITNLRAESRCMDSSTLEMQTQFHTSPNTISALLKCMAEELKCSICLSTLRDPYTTPCNHTFCKDCILLSLRTKHDVCPLCKTHISKRALNEVESIGKIAAAYRELQDAYEEEIGYKLSQEPRQWELNPDENLSQKYPYPVKENQKAAEASRETGWREGAGDPGPSYRADISNNLGGPSTFDHQQLDLPMDTLESVPETFSLMDGLKLDLLSGLSANTQDIGVLERTMLEMDRLNEEIDAVVMPSGPPHDADDDAMQLESQDSSASTSVRESTARDQRGKSISTHTASLSVQISRNPSQEPVDPATGEELAALKPDVTTRYTLLGTHLTKLNMRKNMMKLADLLGAHIVENFSDEVTHVITDVGVAASLQAKQFVPEEEFEIAGDENHGNLETPRRARISLGRGEPPLFSNLHVLLHGDFKAPTRAEFKDLILIGGGRVLTALPPEGARGSAQVEVVCEGGVDDETGQWLGTEMYGGRRLVSANWILDSVSMYKIVDARLYWVEQAPN
ncbi:hypothetical protein BC936DRAFT_137118 [Jimgerdemannia flammicorona]|uniref:RING-type E3 ubiquitin transferase BRCA1 n=1 Tax=Jimgerdemannia flammicorona TaxID=994334 RepID=A0A433CY23_9FUNG|nr:hypothetical protein BC936DRAFT_137118 [Jimgerdemannia flammicorona]